MMSRMKTATVAAMLTGALSLGGPAVQAQTPTPVTGQQAGAGDPSCVGAMHEMMTMMREHMGSGMMGPSPTTAPSPDSHDAHHPITTPEPAAPSASAAASVRVVVTLTDAFRIEPAAMTVPVGVPVTFVVTNIGVIPHEFVVGDEASQDEHETSMQGMGSMTHDDPDAIGVAPGETKELTMTFSEPGETLAGCHIPGHYPAGMRATITVAP